MSPVGTDRIGTDMTMTQSMPRQLFARTCTCILTVSIPDPAAPIVVAMHAATEGYNQAVGPDAVMRLASSLGQDMYVEGLCYGNMDAGGWC